MDREEEPMRMMCVRRLVLLALLGATLAGCVQASKIQPDDQPSAAPGMWAPDVLMNSRTRPSGT